MSKRGKRWKLRHKQALDRQEKRDKRTPQQQIDFLDKKLGPGKGATKERARLLDQILAEEERR